MSLLIGFSNKKTMNNNSECNYNIQLVSLWFKKFIHVLYPSFNFQYLNTSIFLLDFNTKISTHVMKPWKLFHVEMLQAFGMHGIKNFSKTKMWTSMKFLLLWNVQSFNLYKFIIMYLNNHRQRIRGIVFSPYLILFHNFFDYSST